MPVSTVLPAQDISFYSDLTYPSLDLNTRAINAALNTSNQSRSRVRYSQGLNPFTGGVAGVSDAGTIGPRVEEVGGRLCCRVSTVGPPPVGRFAQSWRPQDWMPGWDAADFNGGALYPPGSVVGIFDWTVACFQVAQVGPLDQTGFWWQPRDDIFTQVNLADGAPGGANPTGGFGVALNDDGAGNNQWEFVSYDAVPVILQRTVIGAAIVPDVTEFATFRFQIIAANSGRPANVSLAVNGTPIVGVQNVDVDDVVIMRPNTLSALSANFFFGQAMGAMSGAGLRYSLYCRFGRFTAEGAEIQGP